MNNYLTALKIWPLLTFADETCLSFVLCGRNTMEPQARTPTEPRRQSLRNDSRRSATDLIASLLRHLRMTYVISHQSLPISRTADRDVFRVYKMPRKPKRRDRNVPAPFIYQSSVITNQSSVTSRTADRDVFRVYGMPRRSNRRDRNVPAPFTYQSSVISHYQSVISRTADRDGFARTTAPAKDSRPF